MSRKAAIATDVFKTILTLNFGDGRTLEVDTTKLSESIQQEAMLHGLKAKLVDGAAISRNTDTGRPASLDDKYNAVKEIFDRITSPTGTWNKGRAEDTPKAKGNLLVRALMQMTGKDKTYVDDFLASKTKEERKALESNERVVAIMNELKPASVDTNALLGELGAVIEPTQEEETEEEAPVEPILITPQIVMAPPKKARAKKEVEAA